MWRLILDPTDGCSGRIVRGDEFYSFTGRETAEYVIAEVVKRSDPLYADDIALELRTKFGTCSSARAVRAELDKLGPLGAWAKSRLPHSALPWLSQSNTFGQYNIRLTEPLADDEQFCVTLFCGQKKRVAAIPLVSVTERSLLEAVARLMMVYDLSVNQIDSIMTPVDLAHLA